MSRGMLYLFVICSGWPNFDLGAFLGRPGPPLCNSHGQIDNNENLNRLLKIGFFSVFTRYPSLLARLTRKDLELQRRICMVDLRTWRPLFSSTQQASCYALIAAIEIPWGPMGRNAHVNLRISWTSSEVLESIRQPFGTNRRNMSIRIWDLQGSESQVFTIPNSKCFKLRTYLLINVSQVD